MPPNNAVPQKKSAAQEILDALCDFRDTINEGVGVGVVPAELRDNPELAAGIRAAQARVAQVRSGA